MSCWIVSKEHIDLLVTALVRSECVELPSNPTETGRQLWAQNRDSILARYGPRYDLSRWDFDGYVYQPYLGDMNASLVLKQVDCFDYQTSEVDDWLESAPCRWLAALWNLLNPQRDEQAYRDAPWGVPDLRSASA